MQITDITPKTVKSERKERWAAYGRVSSKSLEQLHSFVAQIRYYKEFFNERPECELVDMYFDEGLSGTEMKKRNEFLRMIEDCKNGRIDKVITKSVSRFARNTEELLSILRMLKSVGVSVYFEEQKIDTDKLNIEMIVTFPGMAAQKESETISGNLRWSYKKRMESGEFISARAPFGYSFVERKLEINEKEAEVVKRIFDLYLNGKSSVEIAELFNKEKIEKRYKNKIWGRTTIQYILNNEKYIGNAILQKSYTTDLLSHKRKKNRGEKPQYYVENSNPPIVSLSDYEAVQNIMKKEKNESMREKYPLSQKIVCVDCGGYYRRTQGKYGEAFWSCMRLSTGTSKCKSRRVLEKAIYDTFLNIIYKLKENRIILDRYLEILEAYTEFTERKDKTLKVIDKNIADLNAKKLIITRLYTNNLLTVADYNARLAELENEIKIQKIERKKLVEKKPLDKIQRTKELIQSIEEFHFTGNFDDTFFTETVEKISVESCEKITIQMLCGLKITETISIKGRCKSENS